MFRLLRCVFKKQKLFALTASLGSIIAICLILELIFRLLPTNQGLYEIGVDRDHPIKQFEPNQKTIWSKGWNFSLANHVSTNNVGFVNEHDYVREKYGVRLAVIGDSYVEALMVPYSETFHARLNSSIQGNGSVYSFGTSGSALSQYLTYAQYAHNEFKPDGMIFNIVSNDFDESLCQYKDVPSYYCFDPHNNVIQLRRHDWRPNPWARLLRKSAFCNYLIFNLNILSLPEKIRNRSSHSSPSQYFQNTLCVVSREHLADAQRAVDAFFSMLPIFSKTSPPQILFVLDGMRAYIYAPQSFTDIRATYFYQMREYFLEAAKMRHYEVLDMHPVFDADFRIHSERFEFPNDGHWNAHAHQIVADAILASVWYRSFFHKHL